MDFTKFRENLKNLIESRNYTIKTFSEDIQIPACTISRYLSGLRTPEINYVIRIAEFFGVSLDWLFGVSGEKFSVMPADMQEVLHKYSLASEDDRKVIHAVLSKYKSEE